LSKAPIVSFNLNSKIYEINQNWLKYIRCKPRVKENFPTKAEVVLPPLDLIARVERVCYNCFLPLIFKKLL
jgi:hypothetical protein